jgi:hypothetical protein
MVGGVEQDGTDPISDGRAARFDGLDDFAARRSQPRGKAPHLGSFSAPVHTFEVDKYTTQEI